MLPFKKFKHFILRRNRSHIYTDIIPDIYTDIITDMSMRILIFNDFFQSLLYYPKHKLNKYRRLTTVIRCIYRRIIFILVFMDQCLYRQPCKKALPVHQDQSMPQSACPSIAISKRVYKFKLIMKNT